MATILLVEDEQAIRQLYQTALELAGFTVVTAPDGQAGVAAALSLHPDLIMTDLMMPYQNGFAMMEEIRQDAWGKTVKVIYMTNFNEPASVYGDITLAPHEFIIKVHTDIKDIIKLVRTTLAGT
jgi:DNA-binding response OmpR family regulator